MRHDEDLVGHLLNGNPIPLAARLGRVIGRRARKGGGLRVYCCEHGIIERDVPKPGYWDALKKEFLGVMSCRECYGTEYDHTVVPWIHVRREGDKWLLEGKIRHRFLDFAVLGCDCVVGMAMAMLALYECEVDEEFMEMLRKESARCGAGSYVMASVARDSAERVSAALE